MTNIGDIEKRAQRTLREANAYRLPVPIQVVAQHLNLTLEAYPLGDVSGMLIARGDRGAIGYNSAHARVRQRFAISHEIAHFIMHRKQNGKPRLFIDRHLMLRNCERVSAKAEREEQEATCFGAALLMPDGLVRKEIRNRALSLDDDESIKLLAKQFWVSTLAMTNRLLMLGILGYSSKSAWACR